MVVNGGGLGSENFGWIAEKKDKPDFGWAIFVLKNVVLFFLEDDGRNFETIWFDTCRLFIEVPVSIFSSFPETSGFDHPKGLPVTPGDCSSRPYPQRS